MSHSDYPEYSEDAALGNKGRRLVENIVHDSFGWLFREIAKDDLGIDALVEVLGEDRKSRGRLFAMQIKCGSSYLAEMTEHGYVYRGKEKHLKYWIECSLPVIIVLCDPDKEVCYWAQITPANVTRTSSGWKTIVPYSQTLSVENQGTLELVVRTPQATDIIPLTLYRLLVEKFPGMVIAQEAETPHDFWGFEYLARFGEDIILITYAYKPTEKFTASDIDEVLRRRDVCARGCGWDIVGWSPRVFIFFVAHKIDQLWLDQNVLDRISSVPEIVYYRAVCDFSFGVSLTEVNDADEYVNVYERDISS